MSMKILSRQVLMGTPTETDEEILAQLEREEQEERRRAKAEREEEKERREARKKYKPGPGAKPLHIE